MAKLIAFYPFCTHEGSGLSNTVADIAKAAPGAVVKPGLALHGSDVDNAMDKLKGWL